VKRVSLHKNNFNNNKKGVGNYLLSFAFTSALHCSKRRQTSRWPLKEDLCRGVNCLRKEKRINLLHENDEKKWKAEGEWGF
jgi:hypothetical protein